VQQRWSSQQTTTQHPLLYCLQEFGLASGLFFIGELQAPEIMLSQVCHNFVEAV
jgi:hypothetical protein